MVVVIVILAVISLSSRLHVFYLSLTCKGSQMSYHLITSRAGAEIYQGACLARGGHVTELQGQKHFRFQY
ncbi:hypothetical protein O9993_00655 [Vibrio lentus]|nr:hypothetical protein [Vibrio lentus]